MFEYEHRVQFYETDLMGIVHHSNYIRFYEEARVAWAERKGLLDTNRPETASSFAVVGTQVRHLKPCRFGDRVRVEVQGRVQGARVFFEYKMWKGSDLVSEARTEHASLDKELRPERPRPELKAALKGEVWIETWLSNL